MRCFISILAIFTCIGWNPQVLNAQDDSSPKAAFVPADIQTEASRIYVFVEKTGLGHQHGVEARVLKSSLILGATEDAGKLVFDMNSFDADTVAARRYVGLSGTTDESTRTAVNTNMKASAVLDVARYPTATFEATSAVPTGQVSTKGLPIYQLDGMFTLHGTQRPLSFTVEVEQVRGWLHVKGVFTLKQTDYGIKPYSKAFGAVGVADELRVYGDLFVAPTKLIEMQSIPIRPLN